MRTPARGFILMGVLIALTLAAAGAAWIGPKLADRRQRDAEEELLFVGEQFRSAIEAYWRQSPGRVRALPTRLEDLLQDPRFPQARRHLRKIYTDPIAPGKPWGLIRQGEAIVGVYSQAEGEPFRKAGFSETQLGFDEATRYADWRFVARLTVTPSQPAPPRTTK